MTCVKCKELGQKSVLTSGYTTVTAMYFEPFYDENGVFHSHNRNVRKSTYNCSNGHAIVVSSTAMCPSCNFGGQESVSVVDSNNNSGTLTINLGE